MAMLIMIRSSTSTRMDCRSLTSYMGYQNSFGTGCGRIGPGESAGAIVDFSVGEGNFCEGNSASGGVFAEGGTGLFGGGSANYGTADVSATGGFNIGVGGGVAVGSQACITRTWCF